MAVLVELRAVLKNGKFKVLNFTKRNNSTRLSNASGMLEKMSLSRNVSLIKWPIKVTQKLQRQAILCGD
jgi:hypothetical protein